MEIINTNAQIIEDSIRQLLTLYDNPNREGLKDTPRRVAKMYNELLTAEEPKIALFDAKNYNQMIVDKNIEYYTFCEHHILPFFGTVKIGYIPNKSIIGLSKLSRIVEYFSKRLNTQEYFTQNIANYLYEKIDPKGIGVMVTGRHLCKEMRGVKKHGEMITTVLKGNFFEPSIKNEFIQW